MKKILAIGLFLGCTLGSAFAQTVVVDVCDQNEPWNTGGAGTGLLEAVQSLATTGGTVSFAGLSCPTGLSAPNEVQIYNTNPSSPLIIDGTTYDGGGKLQISGPNWGSAFHLQNSSNIEIRGFNMYGSRGVELENSDNNIVAGNCIGTDNTGNAVATTTGGNYGIWIRSGSQYNIIGGPDSADRNVIAWYQERIHIEGNTTSYNTIQNNFLGIGIDGTTPITNAGNAQDGIFLNNAPDNSIIDNVISNTNWNGIMVDNNSLRTVIQNNLIGFDSTGTVAITNGRTLSFDGILTDHGIFIQNSSFVEVRDNVIGNSIGGNGIYSLGSSSGEYAGNYIGTDITGTVDMRNYGQGILIEDGGSNTIGGLTPADRNVICANGNFGFADDWGTVKGHGIELFKSNSNNIWGNYVGIDATGLAGLGNQLNGIYVHNCSFNTVGGATDAHRNYVGDNGYTFESTPDPDGNLTFRRHGIQTDGEFWGSDGPSSNNLIQNNWVGIGIDGLTNIGNREDGISIYRRSLNNTILDNVVGFNNEGIFIQTNSDNNVVYGNWVGLAPDSSTVIGNNNDGLKIHSGDGNILGGPGDGEYNVIVGNGGNGIQLTFGGEGHASYPNEATTNTTIQNNIIGHDGSNPTWSNVGHGILIVLGSSNNTIGGTGTNESNLIANNGGDGINISSATSIENTIVGNEIYCNGLRGIELNDEGNTNYASTGSGSAAELYVNNSSSAPNFFGVMPVGASVVHVYEQGACELCGDTDGNQVQGERYLGTANINAAAGTWDFTDLTGTVSNVTVTATDADGNTSEFSQCASVCTSPGSASLAVSPSATICQGETVDFTATAGNAGSWQYTFYRDGFMVQQSTSNVLTGASVEGDYTVVIADAAFPSNVTCQETSSAVALTVNSLPTTSAISGTDPVCDGDVATYSVTNTNNSTYSWSVPTGAAITSGQGTNSIIVDWSGASSGNVSVTETNVSNCTGSPVTFSVTVNPLPVVAGINGVDPVCDGDVENYSVTSPNATSIYTWTVPTGASITLGQGSDQITVDWSGASSGDVTVEEEDANGCTSASTADFSVTVNSLPSTPAISGNATPACSGTGESYSVTNPGGSTYLWTVPSGSSITSGQGTESIIVDFGTTNGNITVTETNDNGCEGSPVSLAIVLQGCGLSANFEADDTVICVGQTITFTDLSTGTTGSTTYSWDFGTGATPPTSTSAGPVNVTYNTVGTATVSLTITDGASSQEIKTNYITIVDNPSAVTITGVDPVCDGDVESYYISGNPGSSYTWTSPTGSTIQTGQGSDSIRVNWTGASSGDVTVTETNSTGCVGAASTFPVTVNGLTGDPGAITGPTGDVCNGASGLTYDFSIASVTNATGYTWTVPSGASIISGSGTESITVDFGTVAGTNRTVTVTPNGICDDGATESFTLDVTSTVTPGLDISPSDNGLCGNELVTFTAFPTNEGTSPTYIWYVNGVEAQSGADDTYSSTFSNGDLISAILISDATCSTTDSAYSNDTTQMSILETPTAEAGPDQSLENPETVILTTTEYQLGTTSGAGISYNWSSSVDDLELSVTNPSDLLTLVQASPTEAATWYTLTVSNSLGCTAQDSMLVTINFSVFIPSGFSPNNDGNNDMFQIHNIDKYPGNRVEIYNRWGSLIYSADDYGISEQFWDGTHNGKDLPMATYYYIVDLKDGSDQIAGPVTIIK